MTLNVPQLITYAINKQFIISHLDDVSIYTAYTSKIKENVKDEILQRYGKDYLSDVDMVIFLKSTDHEAFDDKKIKKIFKYVNQAIGKESASTTTNDYKKFKKDYLFVTIKVEGLDEVDSED